MVSRSDGGGGRCGGGARCGGSVGYIWIHFCIAEYIFCIGGMFEKNYLKFSQIFSKLHFFCKFLQKNSGVPDAAGLSDTFLVLEILVEKKLSQIFSNFLKFSQIFSEYIFMYWQWRKIISNFLKFSQIFSKVFQFFQVFLKKCLYLSQVECSGGRAHIGGGMQGYMFSICCFWAHVKYISELCVVGLIRKCPCCSECFVLSSQEMIASDKHYQQFQVINTISIDKHHVRKHCEKTL